MLSLASAGLQQVKLYEAVAPDVYRYGVRTQVMAPVPPELAAPFVVRLAPPPPNTFDAEVYSRVATFDELSTIPVNNLRLFGDTGGSFGALTVEANDYLELDFSTASRPFPVQWSDGVSTAAPLTYRFTIQGLSGGNRLLLTESAWYLRPGQLFTWTWRKADGTVKLSRSNGFFEREHPPQGEYRVDRFVPMFNTPSEALLHIPLVQKQFEALVRAASYDPQRYMRTPPTNVILTQYTF